MLWYQFGPFEAYYQSGRHQDVLRLADATLSDLVQIEEIVKMELELETLSLDAIAGYLMAFYYMFAEGVCGGMQPLVSS